jgi:hypothetical protein
MTWLSVPLRNETVYIDLDKVKVISIWEKKVEFYFDDKYKQTFGLGGSGAVNKIEMDQFFKIKEFLKTHGIER